MQIVFEQNSSTNKFIEYLNKFDKSFKSILILSCANNNYDVERVNEAIQNIDASIFGASFPKIIYKNRLYEQGFIIVGFDEIIETSIIKNISSLSKEEIFLEVEKIYDTLNEQYDTKFIFLDGSASTTNELILAIFENFGLYSNYLGGGAGHFPFEYKETIFTNEGYLKDSVVLANSKLESIVEVASGWKSISEPMKVTYAKENMIQELDYESAYEKYKKIVEKDSKIKVTEDNFFELSMMYPLGVCKISGYEIAKTIVGSSKEGLSLSESIATDKFVNVLSGDINSLLKASFEIAKSLSNERGDFTFLIDCISRDIIMQEEFYKELEGIYKDGEELIGVLSLGEIANSKNRYLEMYNQSVVISKIKSKYGK